MVIRLCRGEEETLDQRELKDQMDLKENEYVLCSTRTIKHTHLKFVSMMFGSIQSSLSKPADNMSRNQSKAQ